MCIRDRIDEIGFDHSFSFLYSPRPGTPAANLPDATPIPVKKARLAQLQSRIEAQAQGISRQMMGARQRVLVERLSRKDGRQLAGRTEKDVYKRQG